jgi:hypothetical protein
VFDHIFDGGFDLISDKFVMEQLIRKEEIIEKIENSLTNPLRNKRVEPLDKYTESMGDIRENNWYYNGGSVTNEILFDIVEYLDCIIDK